MTRKRSAAPTKTSIKKATNLIKNSKKHYKADDNHYSFQLKHHKRFLKTFKYSRNLIPKDKAFISAPFKEEAIVRNSNLLRFLLSNTMPDDYSYKIKNIEYSDTQGLVDITQRLVDFDWNITNRQKDVLVMMVRSYDDLLSIALLKYFRNDLGSEEFPL